jgi:hypothetical protein
MWARHPVAAAAAVSRQFVIFMARLIESISAEHLCQLCAAGRRGSAAPLSGEARD